MASQAIALTAGGSGAGSRGSLQHAELRVFEAVKPPAGRKTASAAPGAQRPTIRFQFNPKELSIQKAARWERKPSPKAKTAGAPQFTGSDPCKLTLEMFFDATDTFDDSVVDQVEALFACCVPAGNDQEPWPPLVVLHWGSISSFLGFVTSVQARYTLFAPNGTPIRATCSVTIEEMPHDQPRQNPTSGALTAHGVHTVMAGDCLASIAYREYGDPAAWRRLAAFNEIDDPLRLLIGATLHVPELHELPELEG